MSLGAVSFSGLSSGVDWRSMIDKLIQVDHKRVDLISERKGIQEKKLKAWQDLASKLEALKSKVEELRSPSFLDVFKTTLTSSSSTQAKDLIVATANKYAVPGTHEIRVIQTAQAQKVSSKSFATRKEALGSPYVGSLILGGKVLNVEATDTLEDVRDKINSLNTGNNPSGISASIISYSSTDHRLVLTSAKTGSQGMDLRALGEQDLLSEFGFTTSSFQIKNPTSNGALSALFSDSTTPIYTLLGLSSPPQGTLIIGGQEVTISLSNSLWEIASQINELEGVKAQVVSEISSDGTMGYRLRVTGTSSFVDGGNILKTLGILANTFGSVEEIHTGNVSLTKIGGGYIDPSTTWAQVDTGGGQNTVANGDTISISGKKHDGTVVSATYTITDKHSDTIQGLLSAIEALFGNVTASVTAEGKIQVKDNVAGASNLEVVLRSNNEGGGDLDLGTLFATQKGYQMEVSQGRDALVMIDGGFVTKSSNTIDDVIAGVTLDLLRAEAQTTITLQVNRDLDAIARSVKEFVDKYNSVMDFIIAQSKYDEENKRPAGILFGEGTLASVKGGLVANLVSQVWGVAPEFSIPAMVGIKLDNKAKLSLDESILKSRLSSNLEEIRSLFTARGSSSSDLIRYIGYGTKTRPGTYAVNITQVPLQARVMGTVDLTGGLLGDAAMVISVDGSSARVVLTIGMTLDQIVSAINEELSKSYFETHVGDKSLYRDQGATQPITATTPWMHVYDSSGQNAGLQNGDVIRFSGTDRKGRPVSGTYTVTNVETDTVKGLLSSIEFAFGGQVTASIDPLGRVTITDKQKGPSSLSLSVTGPEGRNLNFGTIDVDPSGQDNSREGRYGIPVVASVSSNGKYLVLTHKDYGSLKAFTVRQENGFVLGEGLDGTYSGQDVAGTINGEAATGQGRVLRGNSGEANIDGLSIMYMGTQTGDVGTVTVTMGVAEGFYRSLFSMVDAFEGYITNKQTSLQGYIDRLGQQIENMEKELERKRSRMVQQFVAMEKVMSKLQTQMSWLGQQISALSKR